MELPCIRSSSAPFSGLTPAPHLASDLLERAFPLSEAQSDSALSLLTIFENKTLPRLRPKPGEAAALLFLRALSALLPPRSDLHAHLSRPWAWTPENTHAPGKLTLSVLARPQGRTVNAAKWWNSLEHLKGCHPQFRVALLLKLQKSVPSAIFSAPEAWSHFESFTWRGPDEQGIIEERLSELAPEGATKTELSALEDELRLETLHYGAVASEIPEEFSYHFRHKNAPPAQLDFAVLRRALQEESAPPLFPNPVWKALSNHTRTLLDLLERFETLKLALDPEGQRGEPNTYPLILDLGHGGDLLEEAYEEHHQYIADDGDEDEWPCELGNPQRALAFLAALRVESTLLEILIVHLERDPLAQISLDADFTEDFPMPTPAYPILPTLQEATNELEREIESLHQISFEELRAWWSTQTSPLEVKRKPTPTQVLCAVSALGHFRNGDEILTHPTRLPVLG